MDLVLYNTLSRKKEKFESITKGHVGMYVCGPTVSGESHLGHARPYITFDLLYRLLTHMGNKVRYVRNITDAGHFEEEGREGEDKISSKAILEKLEPMELVTKYTNLFHWAMRQFNNIDPTIEPTATGHIIEQIEMIKKILAEGYAYEINGNVYFDLKKYVAEYKSEVPYGKLSGRVLEDMLETTRELDGQDEKRNKADFALWKKAPAEHIMRWQSPWGEGFPGWHIECSAMSHKYLGEQFDIHGGGMDLQFPHHESEIAQSCVCHNGKVMARYWVHNNMITINGKKMGKSYNNIIKLTELFSGEHPLLEKAYDPMAIRFFVLQSHYRNTLDFSNEGLQAAEKGLERLMRAINRINNLPESTSSTYEVQKLRDECWEAILDDLNSPILISHLFNAAKAINSIADGTLKITKGDKEILKETINTFVYDILGLKSTDENSNDRERINQLVSMMIQLRSEAKARKDYATSDNIRDELLNIGITLKDTKDGCEWELT
ncbi:MAG TPA: cysteine--tRNA ligase [Salinivirgaceae bacterium]|nr:cysteine--tRNA ligase [Salinivirgaceae bacterium]HQA75602.1 cysteine--tRNA ligase [Salinivirgaceae bacterium]